jgi:hypothetical protein
LATVKDEFHMTKRDALFIEGTSLMAVCGLIIASVLVAWALGGTEFKDSIFGNAALGLAGAGFIAGAALDYFAQKNGHGKS